MTKLTSNQLHVLALIREDGAYGICRNYQWIFQTGGMVVTGCVKALERKGFVKISYYRDGKAGVSLTAEGRACWEEAASHG